VTYSCIHTHTELCDGNGSVEDYCRTAFEKGFVSIGFSAHAPITKKTRLVSDWHLSDGLFGKYCSLVQEARNDWKGKLEVYHGLEVDYIKNYISPADDDIQTLQLDFIIGSVHCVLPQHFGIDWSEKFLSKKELLCVDGSEEEFQALIACGWNGDAFAIVESYWNAVIEMCRLGKFDVLGHCDLIKKNNSDDKYFSTRDSRYLQYAEKLSCVLAGTGIVVEINTGGINRGKIKECYPSLNILKIFRKKNIPITINADAHSPSHLGGNYDTARRALLEAGYTDFMLYKGRKDGASLWSKSPL
jgi:histidinol-phosphatase (PHP family)